MAVAPTHHDDAHRLAALLYERHARALEGFCLRRLRDRDDAQEAVQSTFLRAYGALQRGVRPRAEAAWLLTIARNVCASLSTSAARRREVDTDPTVLAAIAPAAFESPDPDLELAEALAALPEGQRRAIVLRAVHGLSYREIAAELDVGLGVVETWLFRARKSLAAGVGRSRRLALELPSLLAAGRGLLAGAPAAKASAVVVAIATTGVVAHEVRVPSSEYPGPSAAESRLSEQTSSRTHEPRRAERVRTRGGKSNAFAGATAAAGAQSPAPSALPAEAPGPSVEPADPATAGVVASAPATLPVATSTVMSAQAAPVAVAHVAEPILEAAAASVEVVVPQASTPLPVAVPDVPGTDAAPAPALPPLP